VRRLALVAFFAGRELQGHDRSTTAFVGALPVCFVSDKEFQGSQ
jgi:hypothetical protein